MRSVALLLAGAAFAVSPAHAADQLKFGPAPSWVMPQAIPSGEKNADAPVAIVLTDEQIALDTGKITTFRDGAIKIQTPEGLAAGNLSIVWNPATQTVTVNKLHIIRGDKVIDVLASGQGFTTLRRETNLDAATLDGTLTASIQPEGLQVGDIIEMATTIVDSDPILKGHVQATFGDWNGYPIQSAHSSLSWPATLKVAVKQSPSLPEARKSSRDGRVMFELSARDVQPIVSPKGAPLRFQVGRIAEATDFGSWNDISDLMLPLFRDAAAIPSTGPLHDEVEKIRSASTDPKVRASQALNLVEDRIRYVALVMGQGSYVPASAETTWSRRFGDCKAKTALLLGMLHSLGIAAEPVLVQSKAGDIIADRLPRLDLFDHVIVRARIGEKAYWLDGTRTGDSSIDDIPIPDFGWVLPLTANASLVHLVPTPLQSPSQERHVEVDASAGIYAPASVSIEETYRGDPAIAFNAVYSALAANQRDQALGDLAKRYFDTFTVTTSSVQFDKPGRKLVVVIKGSAKLAWNNDWAFVPTSSISFTPDFDRPAGPLHDVPVAVSHPRYAKDVAIIRLPAGFAAQQKLSSPVHETLAGVEYARTESVSGDVLTVESSERSLVPEVPYKDAVAAAPRLKALANDDVYLSGNVNYRATDKDFAALAAATPGSADEYVDRGNLYLDDGKYDEAIADFMQALKLDPNQKWALADRGLAHVWKREFDDAEKDLALAQSRDPSNSTALRAEGLMSEFRGDCSKAVDFYTRSLASYADSSFTLGHRSICEASLSKYDDALADSAQALKTDPSWLELRIMRANIFLVQNNRPSAVREADLATSENLGSDTGFVAAARIYGRLGMTKEAMAAFDRALAIKQAAYIYLNRAQSRPMNDYQARLADLDAALKLDPKNTVALAEKAEQLAVTGELPNAVKIYDQVVKLAPNNQALAFNRALLLYKNGDRTLAEKLIEERRQNAKTSTEFNNLCWEQAIRGILLESALQDCNKALQLKPDNSAALDSLAFVKLRLGKIDEAIALYTQAITKNRMQAASYMGRALAYERKGDPAHEEADRTEALKLDPDIETRFSEYGLSVSNPQKSRVTK